MFHIVFIEDSDNSRQSISKNEGKRYTFHTASWWCSSYPCENLDLQEQIRARDQEIPAAQKSYSGCPEIENNSSGNGITTIAKNNENFGYSYIIICEHYAYKRQKTEVILAKNQGSNHFVDGRMLLSWGYKISLSFKHQ